MRKCPVCEEEITGLICGSCGFDSSRNYESLPTFGKLNTAPASVFEMREEWSGRNGALFRCTACGGRSFWMNPSLTEFTCCGCRTKLEPKRVRSLQEAYWRQQPVADGSTDPKAIPPEGCTALATGSNFWGQCNLAGWTGMKDIAVGRYATVGVRNDGSVLLASFYIRNRFETKGWKKIRSVAVGHSHVAGLREDGTVVAFGDNFARQCEVADWTDVTAIAAGTSYTVGLKKDGTVVYTHGMDGWVLEGWRDIAAIAAGDWHTVGLRSDGTVVTSESFGSPQWNVKEWRNITAISAGSEHTVGLRKDGTVVAVGSNSNGQCDVSGWSEIVAIDAGGKMTAGLRADGTVVCTNPGLDVMNWKNIAAISVGDSHIAALQLPDGIE